MLNFKGMYSVNKSLSVKYNETLKALPFGLYDTNERAVKDQWNGMMEWNTRMD